MPLEGDEAGCAPTGFEGGRDPARTGMMTLELVEKHTGRKVADAGELGPGAYVAAGDRERPEAGAVPCPEDGSARGAGRGG